MGKEFDELKRKNPDEAARRLLLCIEALCTYLRKTYESYPEDRDALAALLNEPSVKVTWDEKQWTVGATHAPYLSGWDSAEGATLIEAGLALEKHLRDVVFPRRLSGLRGRASTMKCRAEDFAMLLDGVGPLCQMHLLTSEEWHEWRTKRTWPTRLLSGPFGL